MARTDIPVQTVSPNGQFVVTLTAGDSSNNMEFLNDGRTVLVCVQGSSGTPTVTIVSVADAIGRTGDVAPTMGTDTTRILGPFSPKGAWNQADGTVQIDLDTSTNFTIAAVRLP